MIVGCTQWPPTQPFSLASGVMIARAPGVPDVGWRAATTVARANGRPSARNCATSSRTSRRILGASNGRGRLELLPHVPEELSGQLPRGAIEQAGANARDHAAYVDVRDPV